MFYEGHRNGAQAIWSPTAVSCTTTGLKATIPICEHMVVQSIGGIATTNHSGGGPLTISFTRRPMMSSASGEVEISYLKAPNPLTQGNVLRRILAFPVVVDPGDELVMSVTVAVSAGGFWPFWLFARPNFKLHQWHSDIIESAD